jgi:predicted DNA-binding transcriptional regulator AlpA
MENLTLETLPKAFSQLSNEVGEIKQLLLEKSNNSTVESDRWLNLTELCDYLPDKPAKPTVYGWVQNRLIPHHKGSKRLRFLKSEIDAWLKLGKNKTIAETALEAEQFVSVKRKGHLL